MRWQRARVTSAGIYTHVGQLLWVPCGPPIEGFAQNGKPVRFYPLLGYWDDASPLPAAVRSENVELLPEFSDAEDPDAEVRQ